MQVVLFIKKTKKKQCGLVYVGKCLKKLALLNIVV